MVNGWLKSPVATVNNTVRGESSAFSPRKLR